MLINIFGARGSGKTTLIGGQLENLPAPVVVLDLLGNFAGRGYIESNDLVQGLEIAEKIKRGEEKNRVLVFQAQNPTIAVEYFSAMLWELGGGTLVLDEVDGFSIHESQCYDNLIRYGRNRNVWVVTGCRRPAEVSRHITAGANIIYAFRTAEPRDIDYFESTLFGRDALRLRSIPSYHGLFLNYKKMVTGVFSIDPKGQLSVQSTWGIGSQDINQDERLEP